MEVVKLKRMSRCFWEHWHWELQQRKQCIATQRNLLVAKCGDSAMSTASSKNCILEIDPEQLLLPLNVQSVCDSYIGRGSFGVVKIRMY